MKSTKKKLIEIHEDVPANHYDKGIKRNILQRYWHHKRFKEVLKNVKSVKGPVLDVGCHSGMFTSKIFGKTTSKDVYGIDISRVAIKGAQKRMPFGHFQVADAHELPFKSNFFEAIFCLEMLEHVDYPQKVLLEIGRVLKKDGYVLLLVPEDSKLFKVIWFLWTLRYPVWRHAHVQSFYGKNLENIVKDAGIKILKNEKFNLGMLRILVGVK